MAGYRAGNQPFLKIRYAVYQIVDFVGAEIVQCAELTSIETLKSNLVSYRLIFWNKSVEFPVTWGRSNDQGKAKAIYH